MNKATPVAFGRDVGVLSEFRNERGSGQEVPFSVSRETRCWGYTRDVFARRCAYIENRLCMICEACRMRRLGCYNMKPLVTGVMTSLSLAFLGKFQSARSVGHAMSSAMCERVCASTRRATYIMDAFPSCSSRLRDVSSRLLVEQL